MPNVASEPGAAPVPELDSAQTPEQAKPEATPAATETVELRSISGVDAQKLRQEAQRKGQDLRSAREQNAELLRQVETFKTAKAEAANAATAARETQLQDAGQYKTLYQESETRRVATQAALDSRLIELKLKDEMSKKGITDPVQQAFLMPSIRLNSGALVDENQAVVGNFDDAISGAISAFNIGQAPIAELIAPEATPGKTLNPAVALMTTGVPTSDAAKTGSTREILFSELTAACSG